MADTAIEWADSVWNPTTGCDKVSPGCDNCYALTMAKRLKAMGSAKYQTDGDSRTSGPGFGLATHDDALSIPLRWRKPRRVFVNSMSDLFHPKVPDDFIAQVWATMWCSPRHTFQVLTKRPKRMRALLSDDLWWCAVRGAADAILPLSVSSGTEIMPGGPNHPLDNVWCGTSVEDQQRADERIPPLLDTPAAVRFLSMEPLLGPVDIVNVPGAHPDEGLGWVIVGGESGPGARPMHPGWVRSLREQCVAFGIPFFFKQWGAWAPDTAYDSATMLPVALDADESMSRIGKHAAGRLLDGRTWDEFPEAVTVDG